MRPFYFLRHGQTDWNVESRLQGHTDIPLNETGIAQAKDAAVRCQDLTINRVICSPLQRAHITGQHVADHLGVPLHIDARLIERCFGVLENMTKEEIELAGRHTFCEPDSPTCWDGHQVPRGGEHLDDVIARARAAIYEALENYPDENLLFVAHGAWFRTLVWNFTGGENGGQVIHSGNAVPYRFSPNGDVWDVTQL